MINDYGYQFAEYPTLDRKKIEHIEKSEQGIITSYLDKPTARYHYKYAYQPSKYVKAEQIGWKLEKRGTEVIDSKTGEVIASDTWYRRTINVAEGSWRLFFGLATTTCSGPKVKERLPRAALKPKR